MQPGIEPKCPGPLVNTQPTRPNVAASNWTLYTVFKIVPTRVQTVICVYHYDLSNIGTLF